VHRVTCAGAGKRHPVNVRKQAFRFLPTSVHGPPYFNGRLVWSMMVCDAGQKAAVRGRKTEFLNYSKSLFRFQSRVSMRGLIGKRRRQTFLRNKQRNRWTKGYFTFVKSNGDISRHQAVDIKVNIAEESIPSRELADCRNSKPHRRLKKGIRIASIPLFYGSGGSNHRENVRKGARH